jgi:hypothetical protein
VKKIVAMLVLGVALAAATVSTIGCGGDPTTKASSPPPPTTK